MPRGRPVTIPEDAILDAARDLLLRKGLRASTAEIAAHAGVSEGVVFHRYRTKDGLLAAVLKREAQVPSRLEEFVASAGRGSLRANVAEILALLLASVRATIPLIDLVHANPSYPRTQRLLRDPEVGPRRAFACVERYFAAEVAAGRLRAVGPGLLAQAVFGTALDRIISARMSGRRPDPPDDRAFASQFADLLISGAGTGV